MQEILNSDGVRETASRLRSAYAMAWQEGLKQPLADPETLNDHLFELAFVRRYGEDEEDLERFQRYGNDLDYRVGEILGIEKLFHHFLLGYRSSDDEGTRCIHGLALVPPNVEQAWIAATKEPWLASRRFIVRRHVPEADRFMVWKRLAYGVLLSEWLGRSPHRLFTVHGPRVPGSPVRLRQLNGVLAELRYPAASAA